jgi:hypothetical protein
MIVLYENKSQALVASSYVGRLGHMKALRSLADRDLSISVALESAWRD